MTTRSTIAGSKPAASMRRRRSACPRSARMSRTLSGRRSPIPVSIRTRPAGVSTSRQFSAWRSRCSWSISSVTRRSHSRRGTGPKSAPGVGAERAGLDEGDAGPAPEIGRPVDRVVDRHRRAGYSLRRSARRLGRLVGGARRGVLAVREVAVEGRRRGLGLALVLRTELRAAVRPLDRARHPEEADLPDLHAVVQGDRQVRHVRQLERQVALPAGVDVARGRVDEQAEAAQDSTSFEPAHEVVRQLDPLEHLAEDELARVEDERLVVRDGQHLGQVRLRAADVDVRVAVVAEDPEPAVEVEVDRRRLEVCRVVRPDDDLAGLDGGADVSVGQDAHRAESSHAATLRGMDDRRRLLDRTAELANDFLDRLPDRPVGSTADLATLRAALGGPLPDGPSDPIAVVEALARDAEPGLVGNGRAALLRVRGRRRRARRARGRLADERVGPERRAVRALARRGGRRGGRGGVARRRLRAAGGIERRVHDRRDDGELHGARGRPAPGARASRLERRDRRVRRRAADRGRRRRRGPRHDLRLAPDARARAESRCTASRRTSRAGCVPTRCARRSHGSTARPSCAPSRAT